MADGDGRGLTRLTTDVLTSEEVIVKNGLGRGNADQVDAVAFDRLTYLKSVKCDRYGSVSLRFAK